MAQILATYDPGDVIVTIGTHTANGFAEGSMVTFEKNVDFVAPMIGGQG